MTYEKFKEIIIMSLSSEKKLLIGSHVFDMMLKSLYEFLFEDGDKKDQKETYKLYYENFMHYLDHSDLVKDHVKSLKDMALSLEKDKDAKKKYMEYIESIKNL